MKPLRVAGLDLHIPAAVLLQQLIGNAALAALFAAWLKIPDSHIYQFALSVLLIATLAAALVWLHASTLQEIRQPGLASAPRRVAYALLALWIVAWALLIHLLQLAFDLTRANTRAGFWNSSLSPHLRSVFTYERLLDWQLDLLTVLLWWVLPTLLLPLVIETVARALRSVRERPTWRVYRRPALWLGTAVAALAAFWLTRDLLAWKFGHSVAAELTSLTLRAGLAYVLDTLIYLLVLALIAQLLMREHTRGNPTP